MQDSNLYLLQIDKPKETLLASVEVCRDLAGCILLYKAYLSKFYYCYVCLLLEVMECIRIVFLCDRNADLMLLLSVFLIFMQYLT